MIEALVVVAIGVLLIGLLCSVAPRALASSRQATCLGKLRQVGLSLSTYASEHGGKVPLAYSSGGATWGMTLEEEGYLDPNSTAPASRQGNSLLLCPGSNVRWGGAFDYLRGHYGINASIAGTLDGPGSATSVPLRSVENPSKKILALDSGAYVVTWYMVNAPSAAIWYLPGLEPNKTVGWPEENRADAVKGRHNGRLNVLMVDGHIEAWASKDFISRENWEPFSDFSL